MLKFFGDITVEQEIISELNESHADIDIDMDWEELRGDSSTQDPWDSQVFQFDETGTTIGSNEDGSDSFLKNLGYINEC